MKTIPTRYSLYLNDDQQIVLFPVNPDTITLSYAGDNKTYNVLSLGEIVTPRLPKLARYEWESFFPATPDGSYVDDSYWNSPHYLVHYLQTLMARAQPCRFILHRLNDDGSPMFDTNTQVVIDSFTLTEKGGEPGDIYYKIALTEYRPYVPREVKLLKNGTVTQVVAKPTRPVPTTVVQVNDLVTVTGDIYDGSDSNALYTHTVDAVQYFIDYVRPGTPAPPYPYCLRLPGGVFGGWTARSNIQEVKHVY